MVRKFVAACLCLVPGLVLFAVARAPDAAADSSRVVYIVGGVNDEGLVLLTTTIAASGKPSVVLVDTNKTSKPNQEFLKLFHPDRIVPCGTFPHGIQNLNDRMAMKLEPALEWQRGPPEALWKEFFPKAERVVVSPSEPRRLFLQAACLAGVLKAPLYLTHGDANESADLRRRIADWGTRQVIAVASAEAVCRSISSVAIVPLQDEKAVVAAYREHQLNKGAVNALVVANPMDTQLGGMSVLAPWLAIERKALLLLTNDAGDNCAELVRDALKDEARIRPEYLILTASLKAIPMQKRPNPLAGKDAEIEMEPLTPTGDSPFTFATGRLFHEERGMVPLLLARQRLLEQPQGPRKALIVSNPGDSLPLLETFSRHTGNEFRNNGYETTALFGKEVSRDELRHLLPDQDIFLWEGHYKTLIDNYQFLTWTEPLRPSLIFIQSCLALKEFEAQPLFRRGALSIVGTSTRTYSGTGGAFTLAFFDALLYDDLPLGGALRQAKNYLLAYSLLKQKRLNGESKFAGVNLRSAWAFTLWGDPTLKLPRPERPSDALPGVHHELKGDTLTVHLPPRSYEIVKVDRYEARMRPNARLAGLLTASEDDQDKLSFLPFVFVEAKFPAAPAGKIPRLTSRVPEKNWIFLWDQQRSCGYLLITPRGKSENELRFKISWESTAQSSCTPEATT